MGKSGGTGPSPSSESTASSTKETNPSMVRVAFRRFRALTVKKASRSQQKR